MEGFHRKKGEERELLRNEKRKEEIVWGRVFSSRMALLFGVGWGGMESVQVIA